MAELSQAIAAVSASSIPLIAHSKPPKLPINQLIEQDELPELVTSTSSLVAHGEPLTAMGESQVDQSEPLLPEAVSSPLVDDNEPLVTMPEQRVDHSELLEVASSLPVKNSEPLVAHGAPPRPAESIKVATEQVTALADSAIVEDENALLDIVLEDLGAIASNGEDIPEPDAAPSSEPVEVLPSAIDDTSINDDAATEEVIAPSLEKDTVSDNNLLENTEAPFSPVEAPTVPTVKPGKQPPEEIRRIVEAKLESGQKVTTKELATLIGKSPQAIHQRRDTGRLHEWGVRLVPRSRPEEFERI